MRISNVISILNKIAPSELSEEWDNVGLLIGDSNEEISNVLVSLDCNKKTIEYAIKNKCNLIITHHPIIFKPLHNIEKKNPVSLAIKNSISIFAMHTNMDNSDFSMNYYLAKKLGGTNIDKFNTGVIFEIKSLTIKQLADKLKSILGNETYKIKGDLNKLVNKIFLSTGSGLNEKSYSYSKDNLDICISSEIKHNYFIDDENLCLIEFSHFLSELPFEEIICDILKNKGIDTIKYKSIKPFIEY